MSRKETYINSYVPKVVIFKRENEISFDLLYTRIYRQCGCVGGCLSNIMAI